MRPGERWHIAFNTTIIALTFGGSLASGYGLSRLLFHIIGTPSAFFAYMISALMGTGFFGCVVKFFFTVVFKNGHNRNRMVLLDSTVEALNKIARGDFNVSVAIREHDPFSEVAESVNKMARELASMETQRQDFISNVSHEIQSPLTSINGFAALLKTNSLTENQRLHYLDIIETESKRLSKLSDNLLKLSSLEAETMPIVKHEFRLDKQIRNAVLMLEPQWAAKNISIDAELQKLTLHADEELLNQVWINLLHNAVKFTPEDGTIHITLLEKDESIECRIKDSGIGIPKADQIHIFERFYKVDKSRDRSLGGNGLGLSLCKKIAELHSGNIALESMPGKGTMFVVELKK